MLYFFYQFGFGRLLQLVFRGKELLPSLQYRVLHDGFISLNVPTGWLIK
jgi:hypothetical protein